MAGAAGADLVRRGRERHRGPRPRHRREARRPDARRRSAARRQRRARRPRQHAVQDQRESGAAPVRRRRARREPAPQARAEAARGRRPARCAECRQVHADARAVGGAARRSRTIRSRRCIRSSASCASTPIAASSSPISRGSSRAPRRGRGSGIQFLKHLERTRLLLHIVDACAELSGGDVASTYRAVEGELGQYSDALADRPRWLVLNKLDLLAAGAAQEARRGDRQEAEVEGARVRHQRADGRRHEAPRAGRDVVLGRSSASPTRRRSRQGMARSLALSWLL